jgi:hypothetical protein
MTPRLENSASMLGNSEIAVRGLSVFNGDERSSELANVLA